MHEEIYTAPPVEEKVSTPELKEDYRAELHRKFVAFLEPFKTADTKFEDDEDGNEATLFRDVPVPREQLAHLSYKYPQKEKRVYVLHTPIGVDFVESLGKEYAVEQVESGWFIKPKE
jgi:hypothetical protein